MNSWQWQFMLRFMRVVLDCLLTSVDEQRHCVRDSIASIDVEAKRDLDQNWKSPYSK